ncbi:unnamed protein product [Penicillium camemberti]|uniref:Str. FM013 n=1 Tax=Penicillium camemberti (strain FM 013) TaxID=1429867 RepID=A0A0G4NSQ7_PENC3|nr:unnamed protein product [Penicillium camemberti]
MSAKVRYLRYLRGIVGNNGMQGFVSSGKVESNKAK